MQKLKKRLLSIDDFIYKENNDINLVKEIMSSKEKFLENVSDVEFVFKGYFEDMNPQHLAIFRTCSAHTEWELEDFYSMYRFKEYDNFEIKHVVEMSCLRKKYWVEMYKKSDANSDIPYDCIFHAEMLLCTPEDTDVE